MRQNVEKALKKTDNSFTNNWQENVTMHKKPSEFTTFATFCQIGKSLDLEDKFCSVSKVEKTRKK